ncbi:MULTISPECIES: flagellar brake protein [unclassified Pseudomonas]|uniref:flagellar brake protein n=1 Tax=unclassified Pseudomonas TaxID=196821 RepID=UPI000BCA60DB|nr:MULTISPECIES: flagellar brake protein [unclassified Pseudomonas]PVZ13756.1 c-di-GMP-binding flagellar brake protein YcgR [Pseudomonas sp. URIL14HWK12:I12]PVZ24062.1 c-di-GMP-binding flagellar brake protein YcgR [Pseudomonas sp. URIL14HWK12:I10]PVZ33299.1 c-di-GMP-binding flagellar brake protein YcgR [Pseudomonas sp. URIL14HWK12:I11]SNZ11062.1 c-di-GMP-binding flagellar brake protein YcgR, contains PilZNR and PilZ domains [Pseudomonas sp. URIL14HWK12:I9]
MFNSSADDAPQPPKVLTTSLEILANLRALQDSHDPLIVTFPERQQRFQSYVIDVDKDSGTLMLDELIPRDGERFMLAGEPFKVEGFHDGVRIAWDTAGPAALVDNDHGRGYRCSVPGELIYHQRRNAFRAALKLSSLVDVELAGDKLQDKLRGKLLDISATGCKLRFEGDVGGRLQLGQVYERYAAALPFGPITTPVELRYLHFEERLDTTFAGVRFHNMSGLVSRNVERFVYQLQREARRFDKDDF